MTYNLCVQVRHRVLTSTLMGWDQAYLLKGPDPSTLMGTGSRDISSRVPVLRLLWDHTFKIASNIGRLRPDKKWTCQYDSVFLVFNGNGQVVSWQFTKGNGFDHVRNLLHNVKKETKK